jgi:hypothetical protein
MRGCLRLLLCLPLLATAACAEHAVAGPELAPAPEAAVQAAALAVPRSREPVYIADGVVVASLAGVDPRDIAETEVLTPEAASAFLFRGPGGEWRRHRHHAPRSQPPEVTRGSEPTSRL